MATEGPLSPRLPEPSIERRRRWVPSLVWAIPALAALIGISLVIQAITQRGPTITVSFATAEGIEPGKTKVKFKNVDVGEVKTVHLANDHARVVVSIDLTKEAQEFAATDSRFWVVRPRMAGSGVSGLGTLLSGAYIAVDGGRSHQERREFLGLDDPPAVTSDVPGRRYVLAAEDIGSLDIGSPVFFRRIQVGQVEGFSLDADGHGISLQVFVKAPYDHFVTSDARFWQASGVDLRLDADGLKLQTQSLATILMGGIAFETLEGTEQAPEAPEGSRFPLAGSRADALKRPDGNSQFVVVNTQQSVRGLSLGAPVDFRGIEIGTVRSIDLTYNARTDSFNTLIGLEIYPDRLRGRNGPTLGERTPTQMKKMVVDLVRRGLRAQLRTGNLLTGQLYVAFDFFPQAPAASFDPTAQPLELPSVPGDLEAFQQQLSAILRKLDKIPFDTLGQDLHHTLVSLETTLRRLDGLMERTNGETLPEINAIMKDLRHTMADDSPLQQDTRQTLRGLTETTRSLKALIDTLERHPESVVRGKTEATP